MRKDPEPHSTDMKGCDGTSCSGSATSHSAKEKASPATVSEIPGETHPSESSLESVGGAWSGSQGLVLGPFSRCLTQA